MDAKLFLIRLRVLFVITLRGLNLLGLRGAVLHIRYEDQSSLLCLCRSMLAYWPSTVLLRAYD